MKKLLIISFLMTLGLGVAQATDSFKIPMSTNKIPDTAIRASGVDIAKLVTSTTPSLVSDASGVEINSGLIYWIVSPSTITSSIGYVEVRSTDTANITSTRLIPRIGVSNTTAGNQFPNVINFDPPIPFSDSLSVNLGPAGAAPATALEFLIGIRWRNQ